MSLASETTPDDRVFVPRLSSLLFGGDVEAAVVMAVRQKLGYIEPTLEQSEALQGIVRVNWEVIRLCYEAGYQSSACLSLQGLSAHTHATRTAHVIFIFGERERANPSRYNGRTVFTRIVAAVTIYFSLAQVRLLFKGGCA